MATIPAPAAFDRDSLVKLHRSAVAATEDPKEDPQFAQFAEGVAAVFAWFLGDEPHPALRDLIELG